jgi:hypothetical protein
MIKSSHVIKLLNSADKQMAPRQCAKSDWLIQMQAFYRVKRFKRNIFNALIAHAPSACSNIFFSSKIWNRSVKRLT